MKTLPTVNTLQPILHNQLPVITTELLAKLYGCSVECLHRNHHRNKSRFTEGKHFIVVKGTDLQSLKISLRDFQTIANNVRKLILWTERGAARHAKMLETDQAWDVFERLEDCYFNQNAQTAATVTVSPNNAREVVDTLNAKPMYYVKVCNNEPLTKTALNLPPEDEAHCFRYAPRTTKKHKIRLIINATSIPIEISFWI